MRTQRLNSIPIISFIIIQIFWMSLYIQGVFILFGGIYIQIALLFVWFFTIIMQSKRKINDIISRLNAHRIELVLLMMFVIVNALNLLSGRGAMAYSYFVKALLLLITYMTVIIHFKLDHKRYAQASTVVTLIIGIAALYVLSLISSELRVNPFSTTHYDFQRSDVVDWFGSWSFYMMCVIPMPCLIAAALSRRGFLRFFSIALCFSIITMIVLSTFAAAFILLLMGIAGLLLLSIKKPKTYLIIALIALMYFFVSRQFDVARIKQIEQLGTKVSTIFDVNFSKEYDENDPRIRLILIKDSWRTFTQYPLLGIGAEGAKLNSDDIGHHSGIVDGLAQFGILGMIWYFMFLAICFRRLLLALKHDSTNLINKARFMTFIVFLAGSMINPMFFDVGISTLVFILSVSPIGIKLNPVATTAGVHA